MSKKLQQMRKLVELSELAFNARRAQYARLQDMERALKQGLIEVDAKGARSAEQEGEALDPALRAGADFKWKLWAERRKIEIQAEIAKLRAPMERIREDLARLHGRREVARDIADRLTKARTSED